MAKKFQFRLATLLKIRTHEVDRLQRELAAILQRKAEVEHQLLHYRQRLETEAGQFEKQRPHSIHELETRWHYLRRLQIELDTLEQHYQYLVDQETHCRQQLTAALQRQRSLEKLKERKQQEYQHLLQQQEEKQMDEISQRRHSHNKSTE